MTFKELAFICLLMSFFFFIIYKKYAFENRINKKKKKRKKESEFKFESPCLLSSQLLTVTIAVVQRGCFVQCIVLHCFSSLYIFLEDNT